MSLNLPVNFGGTWYLYWIIYIEVNVSKPSQANPEEQQCVRPGSGRCQDMVKRYRK